MIFLILIKHHSMNSMNVKIHSLCTWKNIINVVSQKKLFSEKEIDNLKIFLE